MTGKPPDIRSIVWGVFVSLLAAGCIVWASLPTLQEAPALRVGLFCGSGIAMWGMIFLFPNTCDRNARRLILGVAVLLRLLLWPAPVSDDVNRYLWEGQLVRDGGNPYLAPASDARWEERRDATWHAMNHRDRATAYPPGIQWIMAAATAVSPNLGVFKVLALLGDLITLLLLLGLLRHHGVPVRWAGFYAFNPIVLIAFAAEGHFDSLMTAALLAALLAAAKNKFSAWLWLGVAIQIKLVCLVLVPLFLIRKLLPGIWMLVLVLVLPSLSFVPGMIEWAQGLKTFASSGAFNAPLHSLLAGSGLPLGMVRMIGTLAFGLCAFSICIARWWGMSLTDATRWMLGALLVCSPIVHFWYVAWLLPFAALRPSFAWSVLSISMGGYFIAWWTQAHLGWWGYGHGVAAAIWLPWLLAGLAQHRFFGGRLRARRFESQSFQLSIVLPVLNAGPGLKSFITMLRGETGDACEIIVVDGGADDGSIQQLAEPNTRLIASMRGRGNQIAVGISVTHTPWVMIVHADSLPRPGWFGDLSSAVKLHPDASLFVFGQRFGPTGMGTLLIEALNEMRVIFGGVAFGDQTMVIRRTALEAAGGFPAQPLMEDVEVSMRLAGQGRVIYLGREWTLSARKWGRNFGSRVVMILRLVATYQLARMKSPAHAAAMSVKMYQEYYSAATERGESMTTDAKEDAL
jgi:Glycosyl transferase family 2